MVDHAASLARAKALLEISAFDHADRIYPIDMLGPLAPAAREIAVGIQCEPALAGQSVLAAAALLVQSAANVRGADGAAKPLSLYALSIAGSGDGKDSSDRLAFYAIREWQRAQEKSYSRAKHEKPDKGETPPFEPYRITNNITVEGLHNAFRSGLSSQGVFSTEASVILFGHSMSQENRIRTCAALCHLWDGGHLSIVRATADRLERFGLRLSAHLMVQPVVFREALADTRLADIGFWPRFLLAWPKPPIPRKYRPFRPEYSEHIVSFWRRCEELLKTFPPRDNDELPVLEFDSDASCRLGEFMEECEERARRGDLKEVAPFALRAAELAARIAGVQAAFVGADIVDADDIGRSIKLVKYSLENWRHALNTNQTDESAASALILYQWLMKLGKPVRASEILQRGPNPLRSKTRRDLAIDRLVDVGLLAVENGVIQLVAVAPDCKSCE